MAKLTRYNSFEELKSAPIENPLTPEESAQAHAELEEAMKILRSAYLAQKALKKQVAADIIIMPELDGKYDNDPYFQEKMDRANEIIERCGVPKFSERPEKQ
jgi:hypothetical protein